MKTNWLQNLPDLLPLLFQTFLDALKPPSDIPTWQWLEENFELNPAVSEVGGLVNFDQFPASKAFLNHADNPKTRQIDVMASAQSAKTENAIMYLVRRVVDNPMAAMWTMAAADQCEAFAKDRLYPAFEYCPKAFELCPKDREYWTKNMLKMATMTLHLRGSRARKKLRSTPAGLLINDERGDWDAGSITTIRQRTTTFAGSLEINIGTAAKKGNEHHEDWKKGSQGIFHFRCPRCQRSQPVRFGTKPSVMHPEAREHGGVIWEGKRPDGTWDEEVVFKTACYECENPECRHRMTSKHDIISSAHEVHRNPRMLPEHPSLHWNKLLMPWAKCSFGHLALAFIQATQAMKRGDIEPLYTLVTEDLGEPFEHPGAQLQKGDLMERIGDYKMGEYWMDKDDNTVMEKDTVLCLTFDRQLMYNRYLVRQWRKNGQSRLVHFGKVPSLDDTRALQQQLRIKNQAVCGDDGGGNASEFRQRCLIWGWNVLKGEDFKHFIIQHQQNGVDKSVRQGWRETEFDPGIGTTREGRATMKAYLWSNPWFKDKLYFMFIRGLGPLWELPRDIPQEYLDELNANEWQEKTIKADEGFEETGPDHAADCELEQLVFADVAGITRTLSRPAPPKPA